MSDQHTSLSVGRSGEGEGYRLQAAIEKGKEQGKLALYFGCLDGLGHYLHQPNGRKVWNASDIPDLPWSDALMDTGLLKNGKRADVCNGKVFWTCGGLAFWYAFYWWDRSVDKRGMANSGFYVRGFKWPEADRAFAYACDAFPTVVSRQRHQLVLQHEPAQATNNTISEKATPTPHKERSE